MMEQMSEKRKMVLVNNELIYQNMIPLQMRRCNLNFLGITHKVREANEEIVIPYVVHTKLHTRTDTNVCNSFFTVFEDNGRYDTIITGMSCIIKEEPSGDGKYTAVSLRFYPDDLVHYDPFNIRFTCEQSLRQ